MAKKIEDIMPQVWSTLEKMGLDDLQIYRVWQVMIGELAIAGWLRKRPGKKQRRAEEPHGWDHEAEAELWVEGVLASYPEIKRKPKKKDHISTTELIDKEARSQRLHAKMGHEPPEGEEHPSVRPRKRKRASEW